MMQFLGLDWLMGLTVKTIKLDRIYEKMFSDLGQQAGQTRDPWEKGNTSGEAYMALTF